jgi:hypothetical protein
VSAGTVHDGRLPSTVVAITGLPGSGKTTLALQLSRRLGWPLIARDTIKEALGDALDISDPEGSRRIGGASYHILFAVAAQVPGELIVESNFGPQAVPSLRALSPVPPIEVLCRCPLDVAAHRYSSRARHAVHHTPQVTPEDLLQLGSPTPVGLGGPLITVDTSTAVDADALADEILRLVGKQ